MTIQDIVNAHTDSPSLREILPKLMEEQMKKGFKIGDKNYPSSLFEFEYDGIFYYEAPREPYHGDSILYMCHYANIIEGLEKLYLQVYTEYCIPY